MNTNAFLVWYDASGRRRLAKITDALLACMVVCDVATGPCKPELN